MSDTQATAFHPFGNAFLTLRLATVAIDPPFGAFMTSYDSVTKTRATSSAKIGQMTNRVLDERTYDDSPHTSDFGAVRPGPSWHRDIPGHVSS
jgi:hypothetical protein